MATINGTSSDDNLSARSNDTISGLAGNDTLTGSGGQDTFVVRRGDGIDTITDFGGVGTGVRPTPVVIAEVDTIKFVGAELSAENMLLNQEGSDLIITFERVENTGVILKNFDLSDLDNLQKATGATVDIGNILFNGQTKIQDSFDVFDANQNREIVFNKNTVTFLNDLDNNTLGRNGSNDIIKGRGGNDLLKGLSGNDYLYGDAFQDTLNGGVGTDYLNGGEGNDDLLGGEGRDYLNGGSGNDNLDGGSSNDDQFGGEGRDYLNGGYNSDYLDGGNGSDYLIGDEGRDYLIGDEGNDYLDGGEGDDYLNVGYQGSDDTLIGGTGPDSFYFGALEGGSSITDFSVMDDTILVSPDVFGGELTPDDVITPTQFVIGSAARDTSDRFIYNQNTGALSFDIDGTGGFGQLQFATLSPGLAMTNADIFVI